MSNKKTLIVFTVLGLATISLISQNPPGPPDPAIMAQHRLRFLTTILSLNTQQQQQAQTIFTNAASAQSTTHESMKSAHDALKTAIANNDSAGITQAATTIGNLVTEMTTRQAKADAAFYALLTPDQQAKFSQLESEGPGMHAGPGLSLDFHP
ncbi:MAG TPA: Spy/CpxP family protein refolding chaperone [Terriglobales bacterium]|nr:Spy/CpxP family protein refolding chaperone [Terriglobales bacterium]